MRRIGLAVIAASFAVFMAASAVDGDEINIPGQDAQGRRTETYNNGAWGKTITTYDTETGFEIERRWYDHAGTLINETFTNLQTGEVHKISYYDFATHKTGRWETTEIDQRVLDAIERRQEALERLKEKPPQDEWDFLPDFIPGVSVYENLGKEKPKAHEVNPEPKSSSKEPAANSNTGRRGHGWFGKGNDPNPSDPAPDPAPKQDAPPLLESGEMPLVDPEPLMPEPNAEAQTYQGPDFSSFGSLGSFNEPAPQEIDFSKYGDQQVFDASRGVVSYVNSQTGTVTTIEPRRGGWFGNWTWTTQAITTKDGKTIHEDYYNNNGNLVQSTDVNSASGVRTSTIHNPDGTSKMVQTDANGNPIQSKVSTTDPKTGQTTTSVGNPDGTHAVTVTDKDGNVISEHTTKDGIPVSQDKKAGDSFGRFDAFQGGALTLLGGSQTATTSAFDSGPTARNMIVAGTSEAKPSDHKGPECEL